MFWFWKVTYGPRGCAPIEDAPDAAGAGGGADPGDEGDGSQPSDGDVAAGDGDPEDGAAAGDDARGEDDLEALLADDIDDDAQDGQVRTPEMSLKALEKKNKKLRRQIAKLLPMKTRLQGHDLDDLFSSKQQLQQFNAMLARNPQIRALLNGDAEPAQGRRTPPAKEEPEEQFNDDDLPFDPSDKDNPVNGWLAKLARQNFEDRKQLKELRQRLEGVVKRDSDRSVGQIRQAWKGTIEEAARLIPSKAVARMFRETCAAGYDRLRTKYTPQQVVSYYLRELESEGLITRAEARASAAAAAKTPAPKTPVRTAATQQRIAETNRNLPRTPAATGHPAPARSDKPTLTAIKKRLQAIGRTG